MSVSCYFENSQTQRITARLKSDFNLSPSYSAHKSSKTTNTPDSTKSSGEEEKAKERKREEKRTKERKLEQAAIHFVLKEGC